jgi:hypothetical protein
MRTTASRRARRAGHANGSLIRRTPNRLAGRNVSNADPEQERLRELDEQGTTYHRQLIGRHHFHAPSSVRARVKR